jgi:hypothetical protein
MAKLLAGVLGVERLGVAEELGPLVAAMGDEGTGCKCSGTDVLGTVGVNMVLGDLDGVKHQISLNSLVSLKEMKNTRTLQPKLFLEALYVLSGLL